MTCQVLFLKFFDGLRVVFIVLVFLLIPRIERLLFQLVSGLSSKEHFTMFFRNCASIVYFFLIETSCGRHYCKGEQCIFS